MKYILKVAKKSLIMPTRFLDRRFYPTYEDRWDDRIFRIMILDALRGDEHVLDLGAGSGNPLMDFRNRVAKVCGTDPNPEILANPFLDEARVARGEAIPYPPCSFDLVFANNVLEHLDNPEVVFREVNRVLKPNGLFFLKTPNRKHYVTLLSRLTPYKFHVWWNLLRGVAHKEVFPTLYRANDESTLRHIANRTGFRVVSCHLIEGRPEYLRTFAPLYLLGIFYERIVNKFDFLAHFKLVIIMVLRKLGK